jgi:pilus assembly protein Flp/PilA
MRAELERFVQDEQGQGLVEYALIVALVAIALMSIMVLFRNGIGNAFNQSKNRMNDAPGTTY